MRKLGFNQVMVLVVLGGAICVSGVVLYFDARGPLPPGQEIHLTPTPFMAWVGAFVFFLGILTWMAGLALMEPAPPQEAPAEEPVLN